jgi:hypothetical protein
MPVVRLTGKVIPPSLKFSLLNKAPHIVWNNQSQALQGTTELRIADGDITAIVDLNQFNLQQHFYTVIRQAQDLVDATLNVVSFKTGIAFSGSFNQITLPDGQTKDCYCQEVEFPKLVTIFSQNESREGDEARF